MGIPQVSVIVRTKDRPEVLKEALKSISDQSCRSIEVVLVNDGGCEVDLAEAGLILDDIPLTYVKHETGRGRAAALNSGVENSRAAYVAILDDDDIYCPSGIAALVAETVKNKAEVVYGEVVCKAGISGEGDAEALEKILGEPFDFGKLLFENYIATNSLMVSKELVEKTGPFDNDFEIFEDWDWLIRIACICEPVFVNSVVGEYRIFSSSTITGKGGKDLHRFYREKLLDKHLGKATAAAFLDYLERTIDRVVLEMEAKHCHSIDKIVLEMEAKHRHSIDKIVLEMEAKHRHSIDKIVLEKEARQRHLEKVIEEFRDMEDSVSKLERRIEIMSASMTERDHLISKLEDKIREKEALLVEVLSTRSWRLTKPLRTLWAMAAGFCK